MQKLLGSPSFRELRKIVGMSWGRWQRTLELSSLLSRPGMFLPHALLGFVWTCQRASSSVQDYRETRMGGYLQARVYSSLVPAGSPETGRLVLILARKQSLKISQGR